VWTKAATPIIAAGPLPYPPSETLISILKEYLTAEEAAFIGKAFKLKQSQTMEQLVKSTKGMPEADIAKQCEILAQKGSSSTSPLGRVMIYRLLPLEVVGVFEYTFMRAKPPVGFDDAKLKKLAQLYEKLVPSCATRYKARTTTWSRSSRSNRPWTAPVPLQKTEDGKEIKIEQDMGRSARRS